MTKLFVLASAQAESKQNEAGESSSDAESSDDNSESEPSEESESVDGEDEDEDEVQIYAVDKLLLNISLWLKQLVRICKVVKNRADKPYYLITNPSSLDPS